MRKLLVYKIKINEKIPTTKAPIENSIGNVLDLSWTNSFANRETIKKNIATMAVEDNRYGIYNCLFDRMLRSASAEKKRLFIPLTPAGQDFQ